MAVPNFVELEKDVLKKWKDEDVFKKTLAKEQPAGDFVFFEGPPTANGMPHIGHVETRAFKDLVPRFKTMQGFRVDRKAGWDTQGLPVELEVEKTIKVSGKKDIEAYGVEKFNAECRKNVWKYKEIWEKITDRIGFWLDMEHPYATYTNDYIETLWWIFKQAWDADLLKQDYKVVPFCTRCGTALSSHEVAQGYERVKDRSVYVKFELVDEPGTFILGWTTTPWTLPGNVALAVKPYIKYIKTAPNEKGERLILALDLAKKIIGPDSVKVVDEKIARTMNGSELVGLQYKPLFDFLDLRKETTTPALRATPPHRGGEKYKDAYTVVPADFVTTEDGTGVVHTAVMYGEDDFELGKKFDLPKKHTVDEAGKFNGLVKPWAGKYVKSKAVEDDIVKYLQDHGELYAEELYEHDYPFCWRCKSPLLYYAKTSWFIMMSRLRDELIQNNRKVNWVPEHIKEGRFGEWLREVKDWAVSRERYWGTPLPIWTCDSCGETECLGSYEELLQKLPTRNRFIFVRHGEATNTKPTIMVNTDPDDDRVALTAVGEKQAKAVALKLKKERIDGLYVSTFKRARQTAQIIADECGVAPTTDARLNEVNVGKPWQGKSWDEIHREFPDVTRFHTKVAPDAETWMDVRARVMSFVLELDAANEGKTFVVVSHGDPIYLALWATSLKSETQITSDIRFPETGSTHEVRVPTGLFREDGSFDPHKPFIDAVSWKCEACGKGTMKRVPEVADAWFDSGSMPYAQWHYPFENREKIDKGEAYPAAFISEAIDQTRGWFYTLLAISTFLQKAKAIKKGPPYETCVVLGHIRDKNGKKLSKSLGNYIDPMLLLDKYGADAVRMYLFTINQPSEPKNFDEDQLNDVVKKNFMILWNVLSFWKLYAKGAAPSVRPESDDVMDQWIVALLDQTIKSVTEKLDRYAIVDAGRELMAFVTDLSTWYVRRSRDRAKSDAEVAATLGFVLRGYAKLSAPFTPFLADALWRELGNKTSVHLENWPTHGALHEELLANMARARAVVETGHALRAQSKLKVRQPLSQLVVTQEFHGAILDILKDEMNVKEVLVAKKVPEEQGWISMNGVALDTTVTDELREEGYLREMVRAVNSLRKALKLKPGEPVAVAYSAEDTTAKYVEHYKRSLMEKGTLSALEKAETVSEPSVAADLDGKSVMFGRV